MADNTPDQTMDDNTSQEKTSSLTCNEETTILSKIDALFGKETVNRFGGKCSEARLADLTFERTQNVLNL